jgi:hypothetical protein
MKRLTILFTALLLLMVPISFTVAGPMDVPTNAKVIAEKLAPCTQPFYPEILLRYYDTDGDDETAEFLTIHAVEFTNAVNPVKEARVLIAFNGPKNAAGDKAMGDVFLKFVNRPIERITEAELRAKFPTPCDLLPKLTERAAGA